MVNPFEETLQAGIAHPNLQPFEPSSPWTPKSNIPGVRQMEINRATREYNEENEPAWYINPSYHTSGPAGMHERMIPDPSERFYNPHADREYSKFQVRANEVGERRDIENLYRGLKLRGKNPMFFETMTPPPELTEVFSEEEIKDNFTNELLSMPFDADMTPSFNMEDIEEWMDNPILDAKIDLQDIFRRYPGIDLWRLIQNLDARGIEYAANDKGIGSLDEYQTASNLHPDEHIYPVYIDYMSTMNPGTKPLMGFEQWKQEVYPYLDVGIDSTLSRT
tara:strand:- start:59 stop:892 length:834 start_codon:yes stop_codon:yes gene_type:complete